MKIIQDTETHEGFPAMGALAMALVEETGMREYIDSMCKYDNARRNLSPGMAVKAMIGIIFGFRYKSPLSNIFLSYSSAPTDLLFGPRVGRDCLNDSAFGRALDTLFLADRKEMVWKCAEMCASKYDLPSHVFHMDATDISLYAMMQEPRDGVAVPAYSGHAKDGRDHLVQYGMICVTDSNGLLRCQIPYSGNASDVVMDRDMIEFLSEKVECLRSTVVADSKMANMETVNMLHEKGLGFVTKCPASFAEKVRERVLKMSEGKMRPFEGRKGASVYDTDAVAGERTLRFVAYNLGTDEKEGVDFYLKDGEKKLKSVLGKLMRTEFSCRPDAERALEEAIAACGGVAYDISAKVVPYEVRPRRPVRGRPPKGAEAPPPVTMYKTEASWEFNGNVAKRMTADRGTQVLVTNLPRADTAAENLRDGARAEDAVKAYLEEYKVEHTYRLMKSGLGVDSVYLHTPERENAMMFVIAVATIISNAVDAALARKPGMKVTMNRLCLEMMPVTVEYDRGDDSMRVRGYEGAGRELLGYLDELGVSHGLLLGRCGE